MNRIVFLICCFQFALTGAQTLITSHHLELVKPRSSQQIFPAANEDNGELAIFASDKEKLVIQKYNSALFFTDSLHIARPDAKYTAIVGAAFPSTGGGDIFYATQDYSEILSVHFDAELSGTSIATFRPEIKPDEIIHLFSHNNAFYIVSKPELTDELLISLFSNGKMVQKTTDFTAITFLNSQNKQRSLTKLLNEDPLRFIDSKQLNPLFITSAKSKMFVDSNKLVLTFDQYSASTRLLKVDLSSFTMTDQTIPQPLLQSTASSNSYYLNGELFQVKANEDEIVLTCTNVESVNLLNTFRSQKDKTISFKNTPLFVQSGNQESREIKDTEKFLKRISKADIGISVYGTADNNLVTVGSARYFEPAGNVLLEITAGVGLAIAGGGDFSSVDLFDAEKVQTVYFDALFQPGFIHDNSEPLHLAADYLSYYLANNESLHESVISYKDYFLLVYYDAKNKRVTLRKFADDMKFRNGR